MRLRFRNREFTHPPAPSRQGRGRTSLGHIHPSLRDGWICVLVAVVAAVICGGCRNQSSTTITIPVSPSSAAPAFVAPGDDPWKLVWKDSSNATPAVLTNGHMGVRIGPFGNSLDSSGKPMPMYWAANYERTGEERLRGSDCPLTISFTESSSGDPTQVEIRDWSQSLDMSNGKIETSYLEHCPDGNDIRVLTTSVIDPQSDVIGQQWFVTPTKDATLAVTKDFDRSKVVRALNGHVDLGNGKGVAVSYDSKPDVPQLSSPNFLSKDPISVPMKAGQTFSLSTVLSFYATNEFRTSDIVFTQPNFGHHGEDTPDKTFEDVVKASTRLRAGENQTDIEIDGPVEDQQAVRSFLYYLRSGIDSTDFEDRAPVSPFGMSSDLYNGHVFWDADIWVFPALAFVDPGAAAQIPEYRKRFAFAAADDFSSWVKAGKPTADSKYHVPKSYADFRGIKFPWESSVTGNEVAPGPSKFEDHITGSVLFAMNEAKALGLVNYEGDPSGRLDGDEPVWNFQHAFELAGGSFYQSRSEKRADGSLGIKSVMSPDENHIGDNDLYTNLLAQWCSNGGDWSLPAGGDYLKMPQFYLPSDKTSFLTYDNDPIKSYKQAAAVLSIYPLQYPPAEAQAKVMMDRFADKVIKNGPAMTDSVHAIIWARIGETDKAYDTWRHGWMDFVRPPFLLFSEKRGQDRTYFYTGAAGELQSVIYGFLGFRIDSKPEAGASWSLKLKGDRWLSIKPNLPKEWKRVTFRNFHVLGKTYTLTATHESVQVTQGD